MAKSVGTIITTARRRENEYAYRRLRVGRYSNRNYDDEMGAVPKLTTHFVAEQIESKHAATVAKSKSYKYAEKAKLNIVTVKGSKKRHIVNVLNWTCDCPFAKSMRLPCRHAMAYSKHALKGTTTPLGWIDARYIMRV